MNFFDDVRQNMGSMVSPEQQDDLKQMGERFYGSIDLDKYKPIPADEAPQGPEYHADDLIRLQYYQLKKALDSGLLSEDLTEEERQVIRAFETQ